MVVTTFSDRSETEVCCGLVRKGVDVDMICHRDAPERERLREGGVRLAHLDIRHRLDFAAVRGVREKIDAWQPDIIHAPRNGSLSVSLLASRGRAVKHTAYRGTIGHLSRWDPASWLTYFHPRVDRISCVSEAVRRYLLSMRIPAEKLVTIHKGHDLSWYAGEPTATREELGVPDGAFVIGFVGSIRPVKGIDVLVRAMALLPATLNARALLVGELRAPSIERLVADLALQDRICFAGFRRDAAFLPRLCDAFVMPSLEREGLPRAVIEAMAQSVPVIVTNVGGMPELVRDGECGLVVPPGEAQALAKAVESLARDAGLRCRLGPAGRERIRTHFNVETTTRRYRELFADVRGTGA